MVLVGFLLSAQELPQQLEDRMGGPENCRMVFGSVHAGEAANVIPAAAVVSGSLRSPDLVAWNSAPEALTDGSQRTGGC